MRLKVGGESWKEKGRAGGFQSWEGWIGWIWSIGEQIYLKIIIDEDGSLSWS